MPVEKLITWSNGRQKVKSLAVLPSAGSFDQVLVKASSAEGDAIWKPLSQAMVIGALSVGSISPNLIAQDPNNRFITDAQASYWNGKVERSELSAYLPLTGGNMAYGAKISFDPNSYIGYGNADNATTTGYNLEIASWWGIGFKATVDNTTRIVFDTRAGRILSKALRVSDFADGLNSVPVVSDANGNLVKTSFGADWVNTNGNRRFVTDSQVTAWNAKVERSELGAYLPLVGGIISGKLDILAQGGTRLEEAKLCINTSNVAKPPALAFHTPGVSAVQLYEKQGHLYVRNDNNTAYDDQHFKVWTQMNHGIGSGLNADLLDGYHASFFTDVNNLNPNANRRFVSDTQISYWNSKVDRAELGAYLPLTGGYLTGKLEIQGLGGTHWSDSKFAVVTTDNTKHPSITLHSPGNSAVTIYQKNFDLFIRSDYSEAAATTHNRIWTQLNHGIGSGMNADLLDGFHAAYFTDVNNLVTTSGKRFVSDSQISLWTNKVERTELASYLPLTGGNMAYGAKISFGTSEYIGYGNADNATTTGYNLEIASWWGIGFKASIDNIARIAFDTRAGRIITKTVRITDFADGVNAVPVVADASGNLAKTAFSADWVNTNGNRRFVTDTQIATWNGKVERSELGAYLPLSGGSLSGRLEINAGGGTHWSESKFNIITADATKAPSMSFHRIGTSVVTLYEKDGGLHVRNDYSETAANVHKKVWTEINHGIGSGMNADLLDGYHAAYFIDVNNLTTNTNRRFVTDNQMTYWNGKVDRTELGAYLPLTGGRVTGRLEVFSEGADLTNGNTSIDQTKLAITTTNINRPPAIVFHTPTVSSVVLYEKTGNLYIRDFGSTSDNVLWSQKNHGIGSGLNADLLDGYHASFFVDVNNLSTNTGRRFVTDTQIAYWNAKVERTELSSYLPLTGGNMAYGAKISFDANCYVGYGNADNATTAGYNLEIASWWGIGFKSTNDNTTRIVMDTRAGRILTKALRISDFADGLNSVPVVADVNGNLVKTSFGADWVNTNSNRRFVTDTQVSYWSGKVDRTELGAYLPLTGGYLTGKLEIQGLGGTHWSDSKLVVVTTDSTKHPSLTLHSPGNSAITIYQKNFDLFVRSDYSEAGANIHNRIWTQLNHGSGSGMNADLLDGFHAAYFTDVNNLITTSSKRFVSDSQISQWTNKVERTELASYLPLTGGNMTYGAKISFGTSEYIGYGTADNATTTGYNLELASWWGIGLKSSYDNTARIVFDTRAGRVITKTVRITDFADGLNAVPVVADANGNLVKTSFSSDWVNTYANRRFVTDSQVTAWNAKVERSELGAYLPLVGGIISGKLDILAQGGTRLEEAKLCINTSNVAKPPALAFHTPGVSAVQLYEKQGHLYVRNDNNTAYDDQHFKVWTQMNHGIGSGMNADLLDGYHASFFTDVNNLNTNASRRFVSDTHVSYWNGKVDRSELGAYLPLAGGTMTGRVMFDPNCYFAYGTGDGATPTTYNLEIASWYGIGLKDTSTNKTKIIFDTRAGQMQSKKVFIANFDEASYHSISLEQGKVSFIPANGLVGGHISVGNADSATTTGYNLQIGSWYGIGFKDTCFGNTHIVFDLRQGRILSKAVRISDFADGTNAVPVISDLNGNLVKSAFSADWINANANRRFVTDAQITYWNSKSDNNHTHNWDSITGKPAVFNILLQENANDKGIYNTVNFSSGAYNVVQVDGNVVRYHVDVVNDDARWSNAITNPVSVALVKSKIDGKADWGHTHHWDSIVGKPAFNISLQENAGDKGQYSTINFSSGAYNVVQVDGNVVRYHVDVVNDDARWSNAITNPVSVALVKSKIDGKADWGHTHNWDSITGKPSEFNPSAHSHHWDSISGKPATFSPSPHGHDWNDISGAPIWVSNGSALISNFILYSPKGCIFG
ncbi:tail fiber protein, partial [Flectobacillus roseus]|uniref:tail fiber protein n=1 Tax=Flectobacillus roseus TaxID=502259 RepID=UPI0024B845BD